MILSKPVRGVMIAGVILALGACSTRDSTFRQRVGLDQAPHDEFLVVSKAPLTVPPNMNLRPPTPGAPPANQIDTREQARTAITGTTNRATGAGSSGEQAILARAGANSADPSIRERLAREQGLAVEDRSLSDRIQQARRDEEELLDPNVEAERMRTGQYPAGYCPDGSKVPTGGCPTTATGDGSTAQADSGPTGLLDRLFGS